jgi:hypothetical protein
MSSSPPAEFPPPPLGCPAVVEHHADGITVTYPPLGLVRGGGFFSLFALLWNAVAIPITVLLYGQALTGAPVFNGAPATAWWYLFPLPFLLVGVGTALVALNLARRRAVLAVIGDSLLVLKAGPFGSRRGEWTRQELTDVLAAPSGIEQNGRPLLQLEVRAEGRPAFALLAGRPDAEVEWLAAVLRYALRLGPALQRPPRPVRPPAADAPVKAGAAAYAWVGGALAGAVVGTVLYHAVNHLITVNGVGLVQRLAGPSLNATTCAAAGAAVGLFAGLLHGIRRRQYVRQLLDTCQGMGFTYSPTVGRDDLGDFQDLPLFRKWSAARDRMSGSADGLPVEVIDYTSVERGSESSSYQRSTVVLLPAPAGGLPAFELRPRDLAARLVSALLTSGITFDPAGAQTALDRDALERFGRHYFLSEGIEATVARLGQGAEPGPPGSEAAIRRLFTVGLLAFFADHPGWQVESDGRHLALHRRQVIPPAGREALVAEAVEIYRALARPDGRTAPAAPPGERPACDPSDVAARGLGTVLGLFGGFFVGGIVGMAILVGGAVQNPGQMGRFGLTAAIFFGCPILGLVLGGLLGNRLLFRPFAAALRKRRQQPR